MLKQEINYKDLELDVEKIKLNNYLITENYSNKGYEKVVTCFVDDIENFSVGMTLKCMISVDGYDVNGNRCVHPYQYKPQIKSIDRLNKSFTFNIVTYITLPLMYVDEFNDVNENKVWEFNFVEPHLYTPKEKGAVKIIYNDYDFLNGDNICELTDGEYIDDNTLRFKFDYKIEHILDAGNLIFDNNNYNEIERPNGIIWEDDVNSFDIKPYDVYYDSPEYIRVGINDGDFKYYQKKLGTSNVNNIVCLRDNVLFNDINNFELYYNKLKTCINIPLSQTFETDLHKQEILEDAFVRDEIENSVNPYIDMEKHVYHPVLVEKIGDDEKYHGIKKIKFNLHFLERQGEDWLVDESSFWNGVRKDKLELKNKSNVSYYPFFSYDHNPEHQSDLLKFLNFKTDDVRYQREKIKRSFLRLSFYDSRDQNSQNLLGYSTIFMDSGKLFSKLMRHVDDQPYTPIVDINKNGFITGINVNVEPTQKLLADVNTKGDFEKIEDYRLSSQFSVEDRNNSLSSSEGFYMYLWADNDAVNVPNDIYMKVEFNHAGYGRTIPFMMPFFDKTDDIKGIKNFNNILNDWKMGGYSIKRYLKYSYIHFKYCYDKDLKKHIYYLDSDTYGNSLTYKENQKNDILFLDLYEGKFNFNNEDESEGDNEGKIPISETIFDLKINSFKWIPLNPNYETEKIINFDPCGGVRSTSVIYSYKLMKTYKTYDECYLFFPDVINKDNNGNIYKGKYRYMVFKEKLGRYVPKNDGIHNDINNVMIVNVEPQTLATKYDYVRYNNELFYYDKSYKYYYKYIENKVNEPIITNEIGNNNRIEKENDTTLSYSLKGNFAPLFNADNENFTIGITARTLPFSISTSVECKIKIRKNGVDYVSENMKMEDYLKMFLKTCDEFQTEGNDIKKYFTVRTDLQSFIVNSNNKNIKIENYPDINPCTFIKNNKVDCSILYESIDTTFSVTFLNDATSFDVKINVDNNLDNEEPIIVNDKTTEFENTGRNNNFYTYDLSPNEESIFIIPKIFNIKRYSKNGNLDEMRLTGYDTISESQNNVAEYNYLSKKESGFIRTERVDVFNVIYLKDTLFTIGGKTIIKKEIDTNTEKWAKVEKEVKGENVIYKLHIKPNLGIHRECILCLVSCDMKTQKTYNITKVITQKGSGNCILKVNINNEFKKYEHVNLCKIYKDENGNEIEDIYGEEFVNGKEYFFVEGSTIKIKAYVDDVTIETENGEKKKPVFKNFEMGGINNNNIIDITLDSNKELTVNFGE